MVIVAWAMALSLVYPAPAATGQDVAGEGDCRFPDVPATSPAHADVTYACRQGWFTGYPDGSFRPDRPVPAHQIATVVGRAFPAGATRADMAAFLRGGRPGDPATLAGFPDVPATHPQNEDIAYAVERSWFQGYPDDTFRPDRVITATQITTVLQRAFPTASTRAQLATFMRKGQQALNVPGNDSQPQPLPSKIAYEVPVYDSLGDRVARELWVADTDGSAARRLTDDVSYYYDGDGVWEWSPGGERIAYEVTVRDFRGNETGSSELWVVEADGSNARLLADDVGRWGWSPGGERIAYSVEIERDSWGIIIGGELWVAGVDGSGTRRLTYEVSIRGWWWSPDGERIAFTVSGHAISGYDSLGYRVDRELWVAGVDGSGARRLTDDIDVQYFINGIWWSPDGEHIVYEIKENSRDEGAASELWVAGVDGSGARRLTDDFAINWKFSPSGESIAYQSRIWEFGSWLGDRLWMADADGLNQRQIDEDIAYRWEWSPGKEMIVYGVKKRDSRRTVVNTELWIASTVGSSPRKLTDYISEEGWGAWTWSPDGESIAYEVRVGDPSDGDRQLWVASADGSGARQLADDAGYGWWWSPGGERIAYAVEQVSNGEGGELWVAIVDGSDTRRLADNVGYRWEWSPDGESIFYDVGNSSGGKRELWVVDVDGSGARRLTDDVALIEWGGRRWGWSPDEEKFAYGVTVRDSRGNETARELWVAKEDGSDARRLADDVRYWRWQPKGS